MRVRSLLLFARSLPLKTVVMLTSRTIARFRRPPGAVLTERDRSRCSCSSDTDNERDRERCAASSFDFDFDFDEPAAEDVDLRRLLACLGDAGGERSTVSASEWAASGKSFERKSAQSSGSFPVNLQTKSARKSQLTASPATTA